RDGQCIERVFVTNISDSTGQVRVENRVTSGTFSLDGETFDVDNNVWVVGTEDECYVIDPAHDVDADDDVTFVLGTHHPHVDECYVIDPAHDVDAVLEAVGGRKVLGVLLTHGHDDHIRYARDVAKQVNAKVHLNPEDSMLWEQVFDAPFDAEIHEGSEFSVGGVTMRAIHTPGHSPGSTCFYARDLGEGGVLFSGDTLF